MLRALVVALLLANLAFFAWARGWLAPAVLPPRHAEHEPERLTAQLRPEAVTVLSAKAASAAVITAVDAARAAAAVCMQAGPMAEAQLAAAETALAPAQVPEGGWAREPAPPPPLWLVFAGRVPDAAARRAREAELRQLGLPFEVLQATADLAPGLVLSRHATRLEADAALAALAPPATLNPALKGTRVLALPAPPAQYWLRVAHAEADLQTRLLALPSAPLAGGFRPCAPARP